MKSELKAQFNRWKEDNHQHGRQAFSRFIMLQFLDGLQSTSDHFIFKGGNLLWHYIKTPRETTDLDLTTKILKSHFDVRTEIEKSFLLHSEIDFNIKDFREVNDGNEIGAAIVIEFKTKAGQNNQFSVDIVYALPTDISIIKSSISGKATKSASIENIIADKLSASHQFKSGNTRMKDYDDLWRIMDSNIKVDAKKLNKLLAHRSIKPSLDSSWIEYQEEIWKRHSKGYKDIPNDLSIVFQDINRWLEKILLL